MDAAQDNYSDELASALDTKQQELKDILDQFEIIKVEDDTEGKNSEKTKSGSFECLSIEEDPDIEIISEETVGGVVLSAYGLSLELHDGEETKKTEQASNLINDNSELGVSKETQIEKNSASESKTSVKTAAEGDKGTSSESENDTKENFVDGRKAKEVEKLTVVKDNTNSVGIQTSESLMLTLESNGTLTAESRTITPDPDPVSKSNQESISDNQYGVKRKSFGKKREDEVEERTPGEIKKAGIIESATLTLETKSIQTEELPTKKRKTLLDTSGEGDVSEVREGDNSELEAGVQESNALNRDKTSREMTTEGTMQIEEVYTIIETPGSGSEAYRDNTHYLESSHDVGGSEIDDSKKIDADNAYNPDEIKKEPSESQKFMLEEKATQTEIQKDPEDVSHAPSSTGSDDTGGIKLKLTEIKKEEILKKLKIGSLTTKPILLKDIADIHSNGQDDTNKNASSDKTISNIYDSKGGAVWINEGSGPIMKFATASGHSFPETRNEGAYSTKEHSKIRTLEDSLRAFGLTHRLSELEESLENVRRRKGKLEEHEAKCKKFDKELQNLCRRHHPDSVMNKGGTEEEVARAKEMQTALNATRTVLNTLNKMFLEDIDMDHKYAFFAKLDIGVLGNEDEVENHVYDVLFKISLVSDIKQEYIISEIRKFLEVGQLCIGSFLDDDAMSFVKHRKLAFYHLNKCVTGYEKLHSELQEVEAECGNENLSNIHPIIRRMKSDCKKQLKDLGYLLELSKLPFGELSMIYRNPQNMDEYFVLPFHCYINVIMACSVLFRKFRDKSVIKSILNCELPSFMKRNQTFTPQPYENEITSSYPQTSPSSLSKNQNSSIQKSSCESDLIHLLYKLASCYAGNKLYKNSLKELFGWEHMDDIKIQFRETLTWVRDDLESTFKIDDYVESGTKKLIVKELKLCKEMMTEFQEKTKEITSFAKEINKNNAYMKTKLDKMVRDHSEVSNELNEMLADTKLFKEKIENYSRNKMGDSKRDTP